MQRVPHSMQLPANNTVRIFTLIFISPLSLLSHFAYYIHHVFVVAAIHFASKGYSTAARHQHVNSPPLLYFTKSLLYYTDDCTPNHSVQVSGQVGQMDGGCKIAASDVFVILQYVGKFSEIKSKTGKGMYIPGIRLTAGYSNSNSTIPDYRLYLWVC